LRSSTGGSPCRSQSRLFSQRLLPLDKHCVSVWCKTRTARTLPAACLRRAESARGTAGRPPVGVADPPFCAAGLRHRDHRPPRTAGTSRRNPKRRRAPTRPPHVTSLDALCSHPCALSRAVRQAPLAVQAPIHIDIRPWGRWVSQLPARFTVTLHCPPCFTCMGCVGFIYFQPRPLSASLIAITALSVARLRSCSTRFSSSAAARRPAASRACCSPPLSPTHSTSAPRPPRTGTAASSSRTRPGPEWLKRPRDRGQRSKRSRPLRG